MAFSQAVMDRLGAYNTRVFQMELVTFLTKSTPTATPVTRSAINVHLGEYTLRELQASGGEILHTDRKCSIQRALLVWVPTHYDELVRADGTRWCMLHVRDGIGRPSASFAIRQVA